MARARLDDATVAARLAELPGWTRKGDAIVREHTSATVRAAVALIGRIADVAEGADHHPDVTWSYTRLRITLSTHDAGGLTTRDFHVAAVVEDVLADG